MKLCETTVYTLISGTGKRHETLVVYDEYFGDYLLDNTKP